MEDDLVLCLNSVEGLESLIRALRAQVELGNLTQAERLLGEPLKLNAKMMKMALKQAMNSR